MALNGIYLLMTSLILDRAIGASISQCNNAGECENLPDCSTETNNIIYSSEIYCNVYYLCRNKSLHQLTCSSGLLFNDVTVTCDYNINVNCQKRTILEDIPITKLIVTDEDSSKSSTLNIRENTFVDYTTTETEGNEKETFIQQTKTIIINTSDGYDIDITNIFTIHENTSEEMNMTIKTATPDYETTNKLKEKKITVLPKSTETDVNTESVLTTPVKNSTLMDIITDNKTFTANTGFTNEKESSTFSTTTKNNNFSDVDTETTDLQTSQYKITDSVTSQETLSIGLTTETLHRFECMTRFGLFQDPESCNYFYQCSHFKAYRLQCPSNLHFNPVLQVCDWPDAAGCENITSLETTMPPTTFLPRIFNISSTPFVLTSTGIPSKSSVSTAHFTSQKDETSSNSLETDNGTSDSEINYDIIITSKDIFASTTTVENTSLKQSTEEFTTMYKEVPITSSSRGSTLTNIETTMRNDSTETSSHSYSENELTSTVGQDTTAAEITVVKNKPETTRNSLNPDDTTMELISTPEQNKITNIKNTPPSDTTNDDKIMSTTEGLHLTTNISVINSTFSEINITNWVSTTDMSASTEVPPGKDERPANFTCPSRFGLFPDPLSCNYFYQCSHFEAYHLKCPSSLHFNSALQVCDWPSAAECKSISPTESPKPSTTYSPLNNYTTTAKIFTDGSSTSTSSLKFKTANIDLTVNRTEDKSFKNIETTMVYNTTQISEQSTKTKSTVEQDVLRDASTVMDDKLEIKKLSLNQTGSTSADFISTPKEVYTTIVNNTFSHTIDDKMINTTNISTVDNEINETQTPLRRSTTNVLVTTESLLENFRCPLRFGHFPDPESCNRFYQCSHFKAYHLQCPSDLHFNPVLKVCDWPYKAGCSIE